MDIIARSQYNVHMDDFTIGDTTQQGTTNAAFQDDDRKNPVVQIETDVGPRTARMEIAPGFYSSPVSGERVHAVEFDGALYGVGGTNVDAVEKLSPAAGERGAFCVDDDGEIVAHVRLRKDGTVYVNAKGPVTLENGKGKIEILQDGEVSINNGNLRVLLAAPEPTP
jgi:hypothetical protein